jgi:hypothetical protein
VRWGGHFSSQEAAWQGVLLFWDLMVLAGDYITVDVVRTVAF